MKRAAREWTGPCCAAELSGLVFHLGHYQGIHRLTSALPWIQRSLVLKPHLWKEKGDRDIKRQAILAVSHTA